MNPGLCTLQDSIDMERRRRERRGPVPAVRKILSILPVAARAAEPGDKGLRPGGSVALMLRRRPAPRSPWVKEP
jgi:hypothetical protein